MRKHVRSSLKGPIYRVSVTFSIDAANWLDGEADRRAISIADLLRRIVDETRDDYITHRYARDDNHTSGPTAPTR